MIHQPVNGMMIDRVNNTQFSDLGISSAIPQKTVGFSPWVRGVSVRSEEVDVIIARETLRTMGGDRLHLSDRHENYPIIRSIIRLRFLAIAGGVGLHETIIENRV